MSTASSAPRFVRAAVFILLALFILNIAYAASASGTSQFSTLYTFSALNSNNENSEGSGPNALVVGADGNFYGTASAGGANGDGAVFKLTSTGTLTTLYTFGTQSSDGVSPDAALIAGPDGNFYGTTEGGGANGEGTVFKITPSGTLTTLYTFSALDSNFENSDGARPRAALVVGSDGNFYGTTEGGGADHDGTVFQITPSGTLTTLYTFGAQSSDGIYPVAALVVGPDGNFYGTTAVGGDYNYGTVFKITSTGTFITFYTFTGGNDGASANALVAGPDGNFYGTTEAGGADYDGTVFKLTPTGTLTTLHTFSARNSSNTNSDGAYPEAALVAGSDGDFYGTTFEGGPDDYGTVFKLTPGGTLTTLYTLGTQSSDGIYPSSALVVGPDGNFYGTTEYGGPNETGTIYRLSGPASGNPPTWIAAAVGAGPSGTGRILWDRSDGAAGLWALSSNDAETAVGPTYGPYAGWTAKAVATASDTTSRVLWTNTNGMAGIWTFNAAGVETLEGPAYGPYSGWTAQGVGVANDGTSRVLWTNTNGQAGVWSFGTNDAETLIGPTYGPYSGWSAKSLATATDGTSRVLWDNANGMAGVWSFGANDARTVIGTTYGPYSGWTAKAIGAAGDGTSRVLWTNASGAAGIWSFNASDIETLIGPTVGPYSGWTAGALGTASDGTSRVLWDNTSRTAGVWSFGANDAESVIGQVYGPF